MDKCGTGWELNFTLPGYTGARHVYSSIEEFRCDNRTAGRNPGCAIPWYASAMYYSASRAPELASHVSRAQASGLPGATFEHPLTRTTSQAVIDANRKKACDDAPSVVGKSCDEYPIATSRQGLSAGGTRRTFDGCNFSFPPQQGASGVSVCMISENDQNYPGGTHTGFFKSQRVLDGDPFLVLISE